jgi:hypothetical protein
MALKVVTPKKQYTSKIKSVTQGKSWEGDDKILRTEYEVELSNGHVPVFNIKKTQDNPNMEFKYKTNDIIVYDMTEKEQFNKIKQFATLDEAQTESNKAAASSVKTSTPTSTPLTQQQSIALSVALKLAKETYDSELWQSFNKIQVKGKTKAETEEKTNEAIRKAKNDALTEIGQITRAYYNTLITKPQ